MITITITTIVCIIVAFAVEKFLACGIFSTSYTIKTLRSRLAKQPVTLQIHIMLTLVPASSKLIQTYKHLIQTAKQSRPLRVPKAIIHVPQRPLASSCTTAPLFEPFKSLALLQTPLQAYHIKWIQSSICRYNKQLQTAI